MTTMVRKVADRYAVDFGIAYDGDWFLLKLQEELGEMTQKYMILTDRTRRKPESEALGKEALAEEVADVLSYVLLFADRAGIDPEAAIRAKWFKYLPTDDIIA